MKKLLVLLLACCAPWAYAQNESNVWYFGKFAGLDFNSGIPTALQDGKVDTYEGSATICNPSGQLLFYTDGITVWNKNHQIMPNGTGLMGNPSSSQAGVIVPKPGSASIYYVFTSEEHGNPNGFRYSEVDLTLNGGLGAVTLNKNILLATPTCEKVTAVKKADGTGYWVVTHAFGTNKFMAYSVTSSGIAMTPVESAIGSIPTVISHSVGYLKASPDGKKMVSCNFSKNLELYDFDALTGQLSNVKILNTKMANYGAEFSPSGAVLYVTTGTGQYIQQLFQYNLQAPNIAASAISLGVTSLQYGALQLARDGKIYLSISDREYIAIIHQPEKLGTTCNVEENGIFIGPGVAVFGLPQFIQSYFDTFVGSKSVCLGTPTAFSVSGNQNITSASWDFGDGAASSELTPSHLYTTPGTYTVTVTAQSTSGTVVQVSKAVVAAIPIANPIGNKVICGYGQIPYNLLQNNAEIIGAQNNPLFRVAYFTSQANAVAHTNILPNTVNVPIGTTNFFAKIYNNEDITCFALTNFSVTAFNEIEAGQPTDYIICENPYDGIAVFNLETKNSAILGGLNASQFVITYHKEYSDAVADSNPLPLSYTNTELEETIYARLENAGDASCTSIVFFTIGVTEKPSTPIVTDMKACSDAANGGASFDLIEKNSEIMGSLSQLLFEVHYYLSMQDAAAGTNPITAPITNAPNNLTIYFVLQAIGNSNCQVIGSFGLIVLPPLPSTVPVALHLCDDSSADGIGIFDFSSQTAFLLNNQPTGDFEVTYHTSIEKANTGTDPLANYTNTSNPQSIYARVASIANPSCFIIHSFTIQMDILPTASKPNDLHLCSLTDLLSAEIDLLALNPEILNGQSPSQYSVSYYNTSLDAQQGTSALPASYNAITSQQTIYIRVTNTSNSACFVVTDVDVFVYPKPEIDMKTLYTLCQNSSVFIAAPEGFDTYSWSTGENTQNINATSAGSVILTVTKNYGNASCSASKTIDIVSSSIATITEVITSDWTNYQNSIQIIVDGAGDYEYSIDGQNYQNSPEFDGLESGEYTVYVRDKNGCGVRIENVYLLSYPKYFTPNGDGYNEQWHVAFSALEPELKVYIFDRFGKLLTTLQGQSTGWDGTYKGQPLPSTDYWFLVQRKNGKEFRGHFSLKR